MVKDKKKLDEREKYWIRYYNAVKDDNYYNIATGGEGGDYLQGYTEEERQAYKEKRSFQTKGEKNPMYGKVHNKETRKKISESLQKARENGFKGSTYGKLGKNNKLSKPIKCVETNECYDGIREASRLTKIPSPNLVRALHSEGKFSAGKKDGQRLHWIFQEESDEN